MVFDQAEHRDFLVKLLTCPSISIPISEAVLVAELLRAASGATIITPAPMHSSATSTSKKLEEVHS